MTLQHTLDHLLPELFPVIASHLPLSATPRTLLSLALSNKRIAETVLPLVPSCLILNSEDDALKALQRLLAEPGIGCAVRELHILCDLSVETREGKNPFDVVTGLKKVIESGSLPHIHALSLHLLNGWHYDDDFEPVNGYGKLGRDFWTVLRERCPRLKSLSFKNIGCDSENDCWIDESGLCEIQGVSSFTAVFSFCSDIDPGFGKLLKNIKTLFPSPHTLSLSTQVHDWYPASELFSTTFPNLRSLILSYFVIADVSEAMDFWNRHPNLERLSLTNGSDDNRWFSSDISSNLLPNLRHLRVELFQDALALAPILHRLVSLTIHESVNAQIPYLLRSVLPDGLPALKSLYVNQSPSASGKNDKVEGALWYETENGKFGQNKRHKARQDMMGSYLHSIVRGAPNLEELGFTGYIKDVEKFDDIGKKLAPLTRLKHLCCIMLDGGNWGQTTQSEREIFADGCRRLAMANESLREVTNFNTPNSAQPPYVSARIQRDELGGIEDIVIFKGYGIQIGNEDEAFPL